MDMISQHLSVEKIIPNGIRVLVVDDNRTCLKLIENLLVTCKYHVTTATTATHALSLLREKDNAFDMVITDVHLPDMDGFKLLEEITRELMDLPVIMMSGDDNMTDVMKGVIYGACHYLIKPIGMDTAKCLWQHVVRKKKGKEMELNSVGVAAATCLLTNETSWRSQRKRKEEIEDEEEEEVEGQRDDTSSSTMTMTKKKRLVWTCELHQKFVDAVEHLGLDAAVPKKILELMDDPEVTRENIASHLQKYRLNFKRNTGLESSQGSNTRSQNQQMRSNGQYNGDLPVFEGHNDHLQGLSRPSYHLVPPGVVMPRIVEHKNSSQNRKEQKNCPSMNMMNLVHNFPSLDTRKRQSQLHPKQPLINSGATHYYNNHQFSQPRYPLLISPTNYQQIMLPGNAALTFQQTIPLSGHSGNFQDEEEDVERSCYRLQDWDFNNLYQVQHANAVAIHHGVKQFNRSSPSVLNHNGFLPTVNKRLDNYDDEITRSEEQNTHEHS